MSRFSRIGRQSVSAMRSMQAFVATLMLMLLATPSAQAQVRATLRGHTLALASVAYSPDGKFIATGSYDRTAKRYRPGWVRSPVPGPAARDQRQHDRRDRE